MRKIPGARAVGEERLSDENPPPKSDALALRPENALSRLDGGELPEMELAGSLESAPPRSFVHVDGKGQVRSPSRYRALQAAAYGLSASLVAAVTVVYGGLFGAPGVALGASLGVFYGWHYARARKVQKASVLLAHDRLDEAEMLLNDVLRSWRCPRALRALCEQNLGAVATLRGHYEEALQHERAAMAIYAGRARTTAMKKLVEYAEIATLVNLGRAGEARQRFEQLHGQVPEGDYLRVQHWVAELYVCLAEGRHELDTDQLYERANAALRITTAASLLGLCAWAHEQVGDQEMGEHLFVEAMERRTDERLEKVLPKLHAWMEAREKPAP